MHKRRMPTEPGWYRLARVLSGEAGEVEWLYAKVDFADDSDGYLRDLVVWLAGFDDALPVDYVGLVWGEEVPDPREAAAECDASEIASAHAFFAGREGAGE